MGIQASRSNAISLQVTIEEYFRDNNLDEEIIDYDFGNGAFTEWHFYCDGDDFKYIDDNILYDYIANLREFRDENFEVFSFRDEISVKILDDEFEESKESVRKSIKELKLKAITDYREIKVFLDGHTEPSKKYQTYDFNRYGKKYEINGITENKDDVTLTFERGKLKSFTYLGDTENFDKENNATHFSNAMDKGWICEFNNNNDGSNNDEYTITFRLQLFEFM